MQHAQCHAGIYVQPGLIEKGQFLEMEKQTFGVHVYGGKKFPGRNLPTTSHRTRNAQGTKSP